MRKIINRTGVLVEADDSPSATAPEGSKDPGDSLKVSELDVGADRQNSEPAVAVPPEIDEAPAASAAPHSACRAIPGRWKDAAASRARGS